MGVHKAASAHSSRLNGATPAAGIAGSMEGPTPAVGSTAGPASGRNIQGCLVMPAIGTVISHPGACSQLSSAAAPAKGVSLNTAGGNAFVNSGPPPGLLAPVHVGPVPSAPAVSSRAVAHQPDRGASNAAPPSKPSAAALAKAVAASVVVAAPTVSAAAVTTTTGAAAVKSATGSAAPSSQAGAMGSLLAAYDASDSSEDEGAPATGQTDKAPVPGNTEVAIEAREWPLWEDLLSPHRRHGLVVGGPPSDLVASWPRDLRAYPAGHVPVDPPGCCHAECSCMDGTRKPDDRELRKPWLETESDRSRGRDAFCAVDALARQPFIVAHGRVSNQHFLEPRAVNSNGPDNGFHETSDRCQLDEIAKLAQSSVRCTLHSLPKGSLAGDGVQLPIDALVPPSSAYTPMRVQQTGVSDASSGAPPHLRLKRDRVCLSRSDAAVSTGTTLQLRVSMFDGDLNIEAGKVASDQNQEDSSRALTHIVQKIEKLSERLRETLAEALEPSWDFQRAVPREGLTVHVFLEDMERVRKQARVASSAHVVPSAHATAKLYQQIAPVAAVQLDAGLRHVGLPITHSNVLSLGTEPSRPPHHEPVSIDYVFATNLGAGPANCAGMRPELALHSTCQPAIHTSEPICIPLGASDTNLIVEVPAAECQHPTQQTLTLPCPCASQSTFLLDAAPVSACLESCVREALPSTTSDSSPVTKPMKEPSADVAIEISLLGAHQTQGHSKPLPVSNQEVSTRQEIAVGTTESGSEAASAAPESHDPCEEDSCALSDPYMELEPSESARNGDSTTHARAESKDCLDGNTGESDGPVEITVQTCTTPMFTQSRPPRPTIAFKQPPSADLRPAMELRPNDDPLSAKRLLSMRPPPKLPMPKVPRKLPKAPLPRPVLASRSSVPTPEMSAGQLQGDGCSELRQDV